MNAGYHNHQTEFKPLEGKRPIEVIAANTAKDVMLQFDVGTCIEAGSDPVAWINQNPGRIRSMHCKDYSPEAGKGYKVLFGEGARGLEKDLRSRREERRNRVLPHRTGGQRPHAL